MITRATVKVRAGNETLEIVINKLKNLHLFVQVIVLLGLLILLTKESSKVI